MCLGSSPSSARALGCLFHGDLYCSVLCTEDPARNKADRVSALREFVVQCGKLISVNLSFLFYKIEIILTS